MACKLIPISPDNTGISESYLDISNIINPDGDNKIEENLKSLYKKIISSSFKKDYKGKLVQEVPTLKSLVDHFNTERRQEDYPALTVELKNLIDNNNLFSSNLYTIQSISDFLGVDYSIIKDQNKPIAFYENNKVVFNLNKLNEKTNQEEIIYHEFTHPIIDHIEANDKKFFSKLLEEAESVLSNEEISSIKGSYNNQSTETINKEIIVRAVDRDRENQSIWSKISRYLKYLLSNVIPTNRFNLDGYSINNLSDVSNLLKVATSSKLNNRVNLLPSLQSKVRQNYIDLNDDLNQSQDLNVDLNEFSNTLFNIKDFNLQRLVDGIRDFSVENSLNNNYFHINYKKKRLKVIYPNGQIKDFSFGSNEELESLVENQKELLISAIENYTDDYSSKLISILNTNPPDVTNPEQVAAYEKKLQEINAKYSLEFIESLTLDINTNRPDKYYNYQLFKESFPELGLPNYEDKNLIISVKEIKDENGQIKNRMYNFIGGYVGRNDKTMEYESFGKKIFNSDSIARQNGLTLSNNVVGEKSFNLALLAAHIAKKDPIGSINSVKAFNIFDTKTIQEINLQEAISNVVSLNENLPDFISYVSTDQNVRYFNEVEQNIKRLSEYINTLKSDEKRLKFTQSYIQLLFAHDLTRRNSKGESIKLFSSFQKYDINYDEDHRERFRRSIHRRLRQIIRNYEHSIDGLTGKKKFEVFNNEVGREYLILSMALMELEGVRYGTDLTQLNRDMTMDNSIEAWIKGQGDYFDSFSNYVFSNVRKIMRRVKEKFIVYQTNKNKYFEEYFKQVKTYNSFKNIAFNYKEDLYTNLFERQEVRILDKKPIRQSNVKRSKIIIQEEFRRNSDGSFVLKEINTGKLKSPNDPSLSKYEKDLILNVLQDLRKTTRELIKDKWLNGELSSSLQTKKMEEAINTWEENSFGYKEVNGEVEWGNYLMVPSLRKDVVTTALTGDLKSALNDFIESEFKIDNMSLDKDSKFDSKSLGMLETFIRRSSNTTSVNEIYGNRLSSLGLEANDLGEVYLVDEKVNNAVSTDLQAASDFYQLKLMKQKEANKLNYIYHVGRSGLIYEELSAKKNKEVELKALERIFAYIVYDEIQQAGFGSGNKDITKWISGLTGITSKAILSYNIPSALVAGIGANVSLLSSAISKKYGDRFFGIKDWAKATKFVLNPSNNKLVHGIMHLMQFHSADEKSLIFNENLKAGSSGFFGQLKGLFVGRNSMQLQGFGDYETKAIMLISQLQKDGILEYFEYDENGNLFYNWNKEEADANKDSTKFSKFRNADRVVHKKELKEAGRELKDGNPIVPYDDRMIDSLDTIVGQLLGQFSTTQIGQRDTSLFARVFMQMKSYIAARANNLYSRGFTNPNISWYDIDTEGNVKIDFYYQEGALNTLVNYIKLLNQLGISPEAYNTLKPEQQATIGKILIDFMLFATAFAAYGLIDDEDKKKNPYDYYVKAAIYDMIGIYNPMDYFGAITTPVTIVYAQRAGNVILDALQFEYDSALKLSGLTKNFTQVTSFWDQLEGQIR